MGAVVQGICCWFGVHACCECVGGGGRGGVCLSRQASGCVGFFRGNAKNLAWLLPYVVVVSSSCGSIVVVCCTASIYPKRHGLILLLYCFVGRRPVFRGTHWKQRNAASSKRLFLVGVLHVLVFFLSLGRGETLN